MTTAADSLKSLARRLSELEDELDGFDTKMITTKDDKAAYQELANTAKSLAKSFGFDVYDHDPFLDEGRLADEAELDEAKSLLLRRDIPEALIHIERAAPEFIDGLPEAVAAFYARRS